MNTLFKTLLCTIALTGVTSISAFSQTIVIKANKTVTNQNVGILDNATILIENGRIKAIGVNADYKGDTVISGAGTWVTPGLFAPYSNLGLVEVSAASSTNDSAASKADANITLRAIDSFNPHASPVAVSRLGGITHAVIVPGASNSIFGGLGTVISTNGSLDVMDAAPRFLHVELGSSGANTAGGSRSASLEILRAALSDAANIGTRYSKNARDGAVISKYEATVLTDVLSGKIALMVQADRAIDIVNIIKLKRNRMKIIIVGAAEAWMVADKLANANISVLIDPIEVLPYSFETLGTRGDNAKLLKQAGVRFAIMTRTATGAGAHNLRLLTQHAAKSVANGLDWDSAFKAITLTPATMMGMSSLGKLEAGKTANLVVWSGDPLEVTSTPIAVIIDGKLQSMTSRQTELADKYNPTRTNTKPYGYRP